MEEFYTVNGGKIPPFGNWDYANEVACTNYMSCVKQASSGGFNYRYSPYSFGDLYAVDSWQKSDTCSQKECGKQTVRTLYCSDENHQPKQSLKKPRTKLNCSQREAKCQYAKPVDEDLYKIPPELIRAYRRKKTMGFFSRLVSTCIT